MASSVNIHTSVRTRSPVLLYTHIYIVVKLRFGITRAVFKKNPRIMIRNAKSFATLANDIDGKNDLIFSLHIHLKIHDLEPFLFAIDIN